MHGIIGNDGTTLQPQTKSRPQANVPLNQTPIIQQFYGMEPAVQRQATVMDTQKVSSPASGQKRSADVADLDEDGPRLVDWLPKLDSPEDITSGFSFQSLVPKMVKLRIRYVADLLQFDTTALSTMLDIPLGDSILMIRKAKAEMKRVKI